MSVSSLFLTQKRQKFNILSSSFIIICVLFDILSIVKTLFSLWNSAAQLNQVSRIRNWNTSPESKH